MQIQLNLAAPLFVFFSILELKIASAKVTSLSFLTLPLPRRREERAHVCLTMWGGWELSVLTWNGCSWVLT